MTNNERAKIVEDRMSFIWRQREELRKEYQKNMKFVSKQVDPDGRTTIISSIPLDKHNEIKYGMYLCLVQMRALQQELYRLYTED